MAGVQFPQPLCSQTCRRQFSVGAEVGFSVCKLRYFAVFFLKICARNNAVKKNGFTGFSCDFVSIYEYSL